MRLVEVKQPLTDGNGSAWLHIPEGWDAFVYRGFLYVLVDGVFRLVEELPPDDV
jgi:hypothetical protein